MPVAGQGVDSPSELDGYGIAAKSEDRAVVEAVAATTNDVDPTAQLTRFINEIRQTAPGIMPQSGPTGMPLQAEYDSERLHPQHELVGGDKSGLLLKAKQLAISFLVQKGSNASSASFVQWLQEQNVPDGPAILKLISGLDEPAQMNMVEYFDMASRQRFVIEPGGDGVLYCRKPKSSPGGRGELCFDRLPFDTSNSRAAFNDRAGMAIWVQGPSGRFYSSIESELGKFHHSSFLAGRDVKAAGDWEVINGHLTKISAQSGHYRPPLESLQDALNDLQRTSPALITQAQVEVHAKADGSQVMLGAAQFLRLNTAELNRLYQAVPG